MESLSDLNKICQKPRYKEVGNWMVRHILRDAALPITWLVLHTRLSANQVTLISLIAGLLGLFALTFPASEGFLAGALLLQLWYLLDHVDGQVARYRGTASLTGRFYDFLVHHIIHGMLFFALGLCAYRLTGRVAVMSAGFLASFMMILFNMMHDIKAKVFVEKLLTLPAVRRGRDAERSTLPSPPPGKVPPYRRIFSFVHKLCEMHVLMNLLTFLALLQIFWDSPWDLRIPFFFFYTAVVPALGLIKLTYWIVNRKIDEDFGAIFSTAVDAAGPVSGLSSFKD